jgi:rod shape-determining protein MreB
MSNNVYGIDLGTCNLKIFCKSTGKVINEKNTIAIINKNQLYAFGDDAYAMYEKAPESIRVTFPVVNGVIADYSHMQSMIGEILEKHNKGHIKGAEFIVAVPTDITGVEKKAFHDLFYKSKFKTKNVLLCDKPIADAVGLDLDVNSPTGFMIVNIGADTTEISVISLGGLVLSELLHFGGKKLDESIISYIRRNYSLIIGEKTARHLKEELGYALPEGPERSAVIVGRDVVSGLPIEMEISSEIVYKAIKDNLGTICTSIKLILEKTPPELAKDIIHSGIYITGGASKIENLDELFTEITNIKVNTCEYPEESAVRGLNKIVSEDKYNKLTYDIKSSLYK